MYNKLKVIGLLTGRDSIRLITKVLGGVDNVYISSTGFNSRILYEESKDTCNFYITGAMGCASSFALGFSRHSSRRIVVIDGDGSLTMRLSNMILLGKDRNVNVLHVLLNNGVHESTGGQKALGIGIDFKKVAKTCKYSKTYRVKNYFSLEKRLRYLKKKKGTIFLQVDTVENIEKPTARISVHATKAR